MIEKIHGVFRVVCDYCGEEHEETFSSFDDAVQVSRRDDWKVSKNNRYWENICPDCREVD